VNYAEGDPDRIAQHADLWRQAGASYVSINTGAAGLTGVDEHVAALTTAASVLL